MRHLHSSLSQALLELARRRNWFQTKNLLWAGKLYVIFELQTVILSRLSAAHESLKSNCYQSVNQLSKHEVWLSIFSSQCYACLMPFTCLRRMLLAFGARSWPQPCQMRIATSCIRSIWCFKITRSKRPNRQREICIRDLLFVFRSLLVLSSWTSGCRMTKKNNQLYNSSMSEAIILWMWSVPMLASY